MNPFADICPAAMDELKKAANKASKAMKGFGKVVPRTKKIGRNDPCPCGSGKKHKRCCR